MSRLRRTALAVAVVLGASFVLLGPASGTSGAGVTVADMKFTPVTVTIAQGSSVTWTFLGRVEHDADSSQGFWQSDLKSGDQKYTHAATFRTAGTFRYFCSSHPEMVGHVRVPLTASGSSGSGWTLRWSSAPGTPPNRTFDVQIKRPGSTIWRSFRTNTGALSAAFDPAGSGTYRFRSRLDNTSNGESSNWSPVKAVSIS